MNLIQITLNFGSLFILFATFLLIYQLIKDRNSLKGYNKYGTLGTWIGASIYILSGYYSQAWLLFFTSIITSIYWGLATIYIWRNIK